MPWYNVESEAIPNPTDEQQANGIEQITIAWRDEDRFKDSPLVVQLQSNPKDLANIVAIGNEQLAAAYSDADDKLDDKAAILAALNAVTE